MIMRGYSGPLLPSVSHGIGQFFRDKWTCLQSVSSGRRDPRPPGIPFFPIYFPAFLCTAGLRSSTPHHLFQNGKNIPVFLDHGLHHFRHAAVMLGSAFRNHFFQSILHFLHIPGHQTEVLLHDLKILEDQFFPFRSFLISGPDPACAGLAPSVDPRIV